MGFYFSPQCPPTNTGFCINTFADTQQSNACSWSNASPTVTCLGLSLLQAATVASNVATYTGIASIPSTWVPGNSVTITGYGGGDAFFNQTCTISTVNTSAITCPLVHGNATAGQTTAQIVNNTVGPFVATDVGKSAMGAGTCATDQYQTAYNNPISASALVNIDTFISSTQVALHSNPANTSTQSAAYPSGSCFIWGHPDDSGFASLWTAVASSTSCPKIFLAAAYYLVQSPPQLLWGNPNSCVQASPGVSGGFGNTVLNAGMEIEGRGVVNTRLFLAPSFPNGDTCTHFASSASSYVTNLAHGGGCFAMPLMGKWQDFAIDGGYQVSASALNTKTLITATVATMQNFSCYNYGAFVGGNSIGIEASNQVVLYHVNNAGCGGIGLWADANTTGFMAHRLAVENSSISAAVISSGSFGLIYDQSELAGANHQPLGAVQIVQNNGGTFKMYGGVILICNLAQPCLSSSTWAYRTSGSNSVLYSDGATISGANGTNNTGINNFNASTNVLINTTVTQSGTGNSISDVAGSVTYDLGGNTLNPQNFNLAGAIVADGHSLTGICTGVGTAASTLALRISGTSVTGTGIPTTCTSTTLDAGVAMTQARTVSTMQVTATAAGTNASSGVVTVLKNGAGTTITCTIGTGTSCNDFTHTVSFAKGDLLSIQFTTQAADTLAGVKAQVIWQ